MAVDAKRRPLLMNKRLRPWKSSDYIKGLSCRLFARPFLMNKRFRLRKSTDFRLVRGDGRSFAHPLAFLYARPNGLPVSRSGFSVGKRTGNAVQRNRIKRLLRESVRLRLPRIRQGWDLLFIARAPIAGVPFERVSLAVEQVLLRAGVLSVVESKADGEQVAEQINGKGVE